MPLHSSCPLLTPIIYRPISNQIVKNKYLGVHPSHTRFVDGKGAIVVNVFTVCSYSIHRGMSIQTRDVRPRFCECWASVADYEQTLNRRWGNVSGVLGRQEDHAEHYIR